MKTKKETVQIFIDGGNFYHLALKKIGVKDINFSFDEFAKFLANGRNISQYGKRYYTGTVREEVGNLRSKEAMSRQTKFLTVLKKDGWEIKTSKLRTRHEKIIIDDRVNGYRNLHKKGVKFIEYKTTREKGIDVKLATDLIAGAIDKKYDTAIIVSSDSDLVPAIDWIRKRTVKKIEYVGFSLIDKKDKRTNTRPLQTMITYTDIQRILIESDLKKFIIKS
ncbi:MAG: NYN domain-containing protein [Candidatus Moraniibacteriota bacterium]